MSYNNWSPCGAEDGRELDRMDSVIYCRLKYPGGRDQRYCDCNLCVSRRVVQAAMRGTNEHQG